MQIIRKQMIYWLSKQYDEAIEIYTSLGDYLNSKDMVVEANYQKANDLLLIKQYLPAADLFSSLGNYRDSVQKGQEAKYLYAVWLMEVKFYTKAAEIFRELGNYKDSQRYIKKLDSLLPE